MVGGRGLSGGMRVPSSGRLLGLVVLVAVLTTGPLSGQEVSTEVQVALAPAAGITEIDGELRERLGLFPDVSDFVTARLFRAEAGGWVLEITRREDGLVARERRALSGDDLADLRRTVESRLADAGPAPLPSMEGRGEGRGGLVLAQTVLGLGFYGWAVPEVLDIESDRGRVAAYLLTAGTSFAIPYWLTADRRVTEAHRDALVWGGTRGILYGAVLGDALTLGDDDEPTDPRSPPGSESNDERTILGLGIAGSVAGSLLGYHLVDRTGADQATVAHASTLADFATAWGFGLSFVSGLYDGETRCFEDFCETRDTEATVEGHLASLGLGLAGTWAATRVAGRVAGRGGMTVGDTRALLSAGLLGAQLAAPLGWLAGDEEDDGGRPLVASLVAGSAAGLWLGHRLLDGESLSGSAGLLVQAGHLAGGATALGLTYLAAADDAGDDELLYLTTSAAGSLLGAWLTFRAVRGPESSSGFEASSSGRARGPEVRLNPLGLIPAFGVAGGSGPRTGVPLLTFVH